MALLDDILTGNAVTGLAVGLGAVLLAPSVLPAVGRALRPVAKAAIKGGMVLYRETFAEIGEAASDLVAEARNELNAGQGGPVAAAAEAVTGVARGSGRGGPRGETH